MECLFQCQYDVFHGGVESSDAERFRMSISALVVLMKPVVVEEIFVAGAREGGEGEKGAGGYFSPGTQL